MNSCEGRLRPDGCHASAKDQPEDQAGRLGDWRRWVPLRAHGLAGGGYVQLALHCIILGRWIVGVDNPDVIGISPIAEVNEVAAAQVHQVGGDILRLRSIIPQSHGFAIHRFRTAEAQTLIVWICRAAKVVVSSIPNRLLQRGIRGLRGRAIDKKTRQQRRGCLRRVIEKLGKIAHAIT